MRTCTCVTLVACRSTVSRKSWRLSSSRASTSCWIRDKSEEGGQGTVHRHTIKTHTLPIRMCEGYSRCLVVRRWHSWSCPRIPSVCSGPPLAGTSASVSWQCCTDKTEKAWHQTLAQENRKLEPENDLIIRIRWGSLCSLYRNIFPYPCSSPFLFADDHVHGLKKSPLQGKNITLCHIPVDKDASHRYTGSEGSKDSGEWECRLFSCDK